MVHDWGDAMQTILLCLAAAAVGVDVGWERMPSGEMEYIIQFDPQELESLRDGQPIQSDVHPGAGQVRSYRIVVGKKSLPRETPPAAAPSPGATGPEPSTPKAKAPRPLPTDANGAAILGRPAVYVEPGDAPPDAKPPESPPKEETEQQEEPWMPLTASLLALFASLGANVFLGWVAWDSRRQFRAANNMTPSSLPACMVVGVPRPVDGNEPRR